MRAGLKNEAALGIDVEIDALPFAQIQFIADCLWDRDLPCPPSLVTVNHDGRRIDAVVQTTKFGRVFLLDRETGKPLFPVEERPVLPSDMPGDRAWPTQPFPVKPPPYSRQVFTEDDLTNISPEAHAYVQEIFKKARGGKPWLPINEQPTIVFPGLDGGTNWGGGSVDPATGWLYVNSENEPWILSLKAAKAGAGYPFGADLHAAELQALVFRVEGVDRVDSLRANGRIARSQPDR